MHPTKGEDRPPRIAYLTGEYPKVSHTFILREVLALRALGAEVLTATVRETGADQRPGAEEIAAHADTFRLQAAALRPIGLIRANLGAFFRAPGRYASTLRLAWSTRRPGLRGALYQLFYFAEAGVLAAWLRAERISWLHNHFANSSCTVAMLAARLTGTPFSFTMHGPAIFFEPRLWRIDAKIAEAEFVSCISHFCRSQGMLFSDQEHWGKLKIVHCGVDPARYAAARRDGAPRILFVGRLAAVKGVALLLEAFTRVADDHPEARLVLIGDGPERKALEAEAARLGVADRVEFRGYQSQDDVAAALGEASIFALPSFAEGVPVALMEAMAAELPVLAPRVAGVQELVEDGVSGFVSPPGDVATLARRLDSLLADPALRARMGEAGRKAVETDFVSQVEAARLLTLFRRAGGEALRPPPSPPL